MTKSAEVAALDLFIEQLGPNSYLGPWLADQRDDIVRDIASDILPTPLSLGAAWRKAAQIVADARESAKVIRDVASAESARLREATQKECAEQRGHAATVIERAASEAVARLSGRRF